MPGALHVRFSLPTCASKARPAKGRAEAGNAFVRRSRSERPVHFFTCVLRPVATGGLDSIEDPLRLPARCQSDACTTSTIGSRPRSDTRFHRGAPGKWAPRTRPVMSRGRRFLRGRISRWTRRAADVLPHYRPRPASIGRERSGHPVRSGEVYKKGRVRGYWQDACFQTR